MPGVFRPRDGQMPSISQLLPVNTCGANSGFKKLPENLPHLGCRQEVPYRNPGSAPAIGEENRPPVSLGITDGNETWAVRGFTPLHAHKAIWETETDVQQVAVNIQGN